jgi:hypothetical protein
MDIGDLAMQQVAHEMMRTDEGDPAFLHPAPTSVVASTITL